MDIDIVGNGKRSEDIPPVVELQPSPEGEDDEDEEDPNDDEDDGKVGRRTVDDEQPPLIKRSAKFRAAW